MLLFTICLILLTLFSYVYMKKRSILSLLFMFLSATFYGSYQILEKTRNFIYFYFSVLFTMLISAFLLQFLATENKSLNFIYSLMFLVCSFVYMNLIRMIYNIKQNNLNEAPKGLQGKQGKIGEQGKMTI